MTNPSHENRRQRAWEVRYICRLNECYWKRIFHSRRSRLFWFHCIWPIVVFCVLVSPTAFDFEWNPAIVLGLLSLAISLVTEFGLGKRTERLRSYCRDWSELAHDGNILWREGEDRGWGRETVISQLSRLETRMCTSQANELEHPNNSILIECERELYEERGLPFPRQGLNSYE